MHTLLPNLKIARRTGKTFIRTYTLIYFTAKSILLKGKATFIVYGVGDVPIITFGAFSRIALTAIFIYGAVDGDIFSYQTGSGIFIPHIAIIAG